MIIVTSGARYLDIDAYACCIAYAELLNLLGQPAKAVSTAVLNESITPSLRALPANLETTYTPSPDDVFVMADLSDPDHFDSIVNLDHVIEVFDHHPGYEQYWQDKLGDKSHIDFIGAAATLIAEEWQKAGLLDRMSQPSAKLLAAAILDNTLNFNASVTTDRDKSMYEFLRSHAALDDQWVASYFTECQRNIMNDLPVALKNDTKFLQFNGMPERLCVGQLVVWDASSFMADELPAITKHFEAIQKQWFVNIVSIDEGHSYLLCQDAPTQQWLEGLLHVTFDGNIAKAGRLWLRKEIMKADQEA